MGGGGPESIACSSGTCRGELGKGGDCSIGEVVRNTVIGLEAGEMVDGGVEEAFEPSFVSIEVRHGFDILSKAVCR